MEASDVYGEELKMKIVSEEEDEDSDVEMKDLLKRDKEKYLSFLDDTLDETHMKTQLNLVSSRPKTPGTFPKSP